VEFHPCNSRVGKLAVICDTDTFPFIITKFIPVVTLFIFGEFSHSFLPEFITSLIIITLLIPLISDNPLTIYPFCCIYLLSMIYRTHPSSPYFLDAADANVCA
jgi:hypothetical protein